MTAPIEGFSYVLGFLTAEEQRTLLEQVQGLAYTHEVVRGQPLKRGRVEFGIGYATVGRKAKPAPPMPPFLEALIAQGLPHCPPGTTYNSCLLWRYPAGAGIGWHMDAPLFGDCIMAVSLGAEARLQFRPKGSTVVSYELRPASGSLWIMRGPARWDFQHQIVPVKAERFSLTFRHVPQPGGTGGSR